MFEQAAAGLLGLPMIAIAHVEMIRGCAWSRSGHHALIGAIQVVTASGETRQEPRRNDANRSRREQRVRRAGARDLQGAGSQRGDKQQGHPY